MTRKSANRSRSAGAGHARAPASWRLLVGGLLLVSLACNVTALFVPFMEMRVGLHRQPYSLFHTASMLWSSGLQVLAVLVVGFSVVFPFVKLGVLSWLCLTGPIEGSRRHWLALVDRLGKWSMLDVFLVCLILALSSGHLLLGARPLIGLAAFVSAIVLSMASGELLSAELPRVVVPPAVSPRALWRSGFFLALSGIALAGALGFPFLKIHEWFVADKSYSIVTAVLALFRAGSPLPAVIIGLFLFILPLATWLVTCAWWWELLRHQPDQPLYRRALLGRRWSMLDVFGVALAIFAVEGGSLIKTEVRWGALFLAALVGGQHALQAALPRSFAKK